MCLLIKLSYFLLAKGICEPHCFLDMFVLFVCVCCSSSQDPDVQWNSDHSLDEGHRVAMQGRRRPSSHHQVAQGKVSRPQTLVYNNPAAFHQAL